jgi:hypothetical protein
MLARSRSAQPETPVCSAFLEAPALCQSPQRDQAVFMGTGSRRARASSHIPADDMSFGNIMLIARQKPDATNVAGLRTWNSLGRFVKRGEKGIFILAPMVGKRSTKDVATDEPSEDATTEGQRTLYGFRAVYVFDRLSRDLRPEPLRARRIPPVDVLLGSGQRCTHHRSTPRSCATLADPGGP